MNQPTLTLSVRPEGGPGRRTFSFDLILEDRVLAQASLNAVQSQEVVEMAHQYAALLVGAGGRKDAEEYLDLLGDGMFRLWFGEAWEEAGAQIARAQSLLVISEDVEVLALPWEVVRLPGQERAVGGWQVRRLPLSGSSMPSFSGTLGGGLRTLSAVCAPRRMKRIDHEIVEEVMDLAASGLQMSLYQGQTGSLKELEELASWFGPQAVHLAGTVMMKDGRACLAFEDPAGNIDLRNAEEIRVAVGPSSCVIINGVSAGESPLAAFTLCQDLARAGVSLVVSLAGPLDSDSALAFFTGFFESLAAGEAVDQSVAAGRESLQKGGEYRWTLPVLYCSDDQSLIFDPQAAPDLVLEMDLGHPPLPGMVTGGCRAFLGRRRELQRLLPGLKDGSLRAVILTGHPGSGKSTLAVRLCWELGMPVMAVDLGRGRPLGPALVLDACICSLDRLARELKGRDGALSEDLETAAAVLSDSKMPVEERMKMVVQALNKGRMVLLLEGLDSCLGPDGRLDGEISGFYRDLLAGLSVGRALVVSPTLPGEVPILPSGTRNEWVGDLSRAAFCRHLLLSGADDRQLLSKLHAIFGSGPRFLEQIGRGLRVLSREELTRDLESTTLPVSHKLQSEERERLFQEIFLSRLYQSLRPASQEGLRRAAVYEVPISSPGLQAILGGGVLAASEASEGMMVEWLEAGLCFSVDGGDLWAVFGHLRPWLLERLTPVERIQAHRDAGAFLEAKARAGHEELGLSRLESLLSARTQYLEAREMDKAREVTMLLSNFLERRGLYGDMLRLNQDLLTYGDDAAALGRAGLAHFYLEEFPPADDMFERALVLYQRARDLPGQASSLYNLGLIALEQDLLDRAEEKFQCSLDLQQDSGDVRGEATTWQRLAMISLRRKDHPLARERFTRALSLQQEAEDPAGEASSHHHLALIALAGDGLQQAEEEMEKALQLYRGLGDLGGQAAALDGMASIATRREDYQQALERLREVQPLLARLGHSRAEAATWHNIGTMESQLGKRDMAQGSFRRAVELQQQIGDRDGEAASLFQLGVLAVWLGRLKEALILISMSGMILRSIDSPDFKQIEPFVDRLSSQLSLSDQEFMDLIKQTGKEYASDRGRELMNSVFGELE